MTLEEIRKQLNSALNYKFSPMCGKNDDTRAQADLCRTYMPKLLAVAEAAQVVIDGGIVEASDPQLDNLEILHQALEALTKE